MCVSNKIASNEIIVRTIFSDLVKKNDNEIRPNAFHSYPKDADEVSVTRYSFTDSLFCKLLKNLINKSGYCGLASIYAYKIYAIEADIAFTPTKDNFLHSDIKIGYISQLGVTMHPYYSEKIKRMSKVAKFHPDTCPTNNDNWCGDEIISPNP